jgi:type IV pilus assembly protein PilA
MLRKLRNRKGFTLVELMIVVAIIGILAAIAIPNFLNFRLKAKTSEAKSNLGAIRSTEVAYFAEWDTWVGNQGFSPVSAGNAASQRAGNDAKVAWLDTSRFSILGFAPEGSVFFDYDLEGADWPVGTAGFTSNASGDLDADNSLSNFKITSNDTDIRHSGAPF